MLQGKLVFSRQKHHCLCRLPPSRMVQGPMATRRGSFGQCSCCSPPGVALVIFLDLGCIRRALGLGPSQLLFLFLGPSPPPDIPWLTHSLPLLHAQMSAYQWVFVDYFFFNSHLHHQPLAMPSPAVLFSIDLYPTESTL